MATARRHSVFFNFLCGGVFALGMASVAAADGNYRDLFIWARSMELPQKLLGSFPLRIVEPGSGNPLAGARIVVAASHPPLVWKSDDDGMLWIPYDPKIYRSNPPLRTEPGGVQFKVRFTATATGQRYQRVEWRTASELKKIGDAQVAVFHRGGEENLSGEVLAETIRCHAAVKKALGIDPVPTAVILETADKENDVLYLAFSEAGYHDTWICFQNRWTSGEFSKVHTHEVTESTLMATLPLYEDPRNRFIGDGIAEWVSWNAHGLPADYLGYLSPEKVGKADTVDLLEVFQAMKRPPAQRRLRLGRMDAAGYVPGYALSFAFWHALTEEHGPDLIPRFIHEIKTRKSLGAEESLGILTRLTGDPKLGERVRSVSVADARRRIETLMNRNR